MEIVEKKKEIVEGYSLGDLEKQIYLNEEIIHPLQNISSEIKFVVSKFMGEDYLKVNFPAELSFAVYDYIYSSNRKYQPDLGYD